MPTVNARAEPRQNGLTIHNFVDIGTAAHAPTLRDA